MIPSYPLVFPIGLIFKFHHPKAPSKADHHGEILDVEGKVLQLHLFAELPMDEPHELQLRFSHRVLPGEPSWERTVIGNSHKKCEISDYIIYVIMWYYVLCLLFWFWYTQYFLLGIRESDIPCKKHLLQPAGCSFQSSPNDSNLNLPMFCITVSLCSL